jgi:hypothetical protein
MLATLSAPAVYASLAGEWLVERGGIQVECPDFFIGSDIEMKPSATGPFPYSPIVSRPRL